MNDPTMGGDRQEITNSIQIEGGQLIVYRAIHIISDGSGYEQERVKFVPYAKNENVSGFDMIASPRLPLVDRDGTS